MTRTSLSIGLHCFLGALIGIGIALGFGHYFETASARLMVDITGLIIGAGGAYLAVDFDETKAGVARAYTLTINWKPNKLYWKAVGLRLVAGFLMLLLFCCVTDAVIFVAHKTGDQPLTMAQRIVMYAFIIVSGMLIYAPSMLFAHRRSAPIYDKHERVVMGADGKRKRRTQMGYHGFLMQSMRTSVRRMKEWNPVSTPVIFAFVLALALGFCAKMVFFGALWLAINVPRAIGRLVKRVAAFVGMAFRFIHSERRTIVLVDTAIGIVAGLWWSESFLPAIAFGGAVGAVLGVLNYELVSVRWLKLAVR